MGSSRQRKIRESYTSYLKNINGLDDEQKEQLSPWQPINMLSWYSGKATGRVMPYQRTPLSLLSASIAFLGEIDPPER